VEFYVLGEAEAEAEASACHRWQTRLALHHEPAVHPGSFLFVYLSQM
jgi:hypothetical protein